MSGNVRTQSPLEKTMNAETRTKYLEKLKDSTPYTHKDIYYQGQKQKLAVYKIDLDYLVYNRWNGRIASLVKSHYSETGQEIDPTTQEGITLIEEFLWRSNKQANEGTLEKAFASMVKMNMEL